MGLEVADSNSRQCTETAGQEGEAKVAHMLQGLHDFLANKHFNLVSWLTSFCVGSCRMGRD